MERNQLGCTTRVDARYYFNICVNDIFLLMSGTVICNYADYSTLYSCDYEVKYVMTKVEQVANRLRTWFPEKCMKLNEDRCYLIPFGGSKEEAKCTLWGNPNTRK